MNRLVCFAMVTLFPRVDALPGLSELDIELRVAAFRRESTLLVWVGAVAGALLFQLAPIATLGRPVFATALEPDDLDTHANKLATHRVYLVRQAMFLLKLMGGIFWGQSDDIRASIQLPAYDRDPGTRRVGRTVLAEPVAPRALVARLVTLGIREHERGRGSVVREH